MSEGQHLRIGDVVARTGLTERAIRHYEKLGLVAPARSPSGQRIYDVVAISALARVRMLRQAGFSLDDIQKMQSTPADAKAIIGAHLSGLRARTEELQSAIRKLEIIENGLDKNHQSDIALICTILEIAETCEDGARWRTVLARYLNNQQTDDWMIMREQLRERVDPEHYDQAWTDLINEIKRALPLNPTSSEAQGFLDRWEVLLAPFRDVASPDQQKTAAEMWSGVGSWNQSVDHPMTQEVADFIRAAYSTQKNKRNDTT